ncbi:putative ribonuclease H protein At1g65750 isoform X3 [Rosa rugosa]|uniref:putative ribonuclease H protein At1g65750 isoform X3 n=1 Tax=Rosa rugosa TaxID=74645 RepID=UPI002B40B8A0|nr:putative ribonuclease H protein At1g65750 isoform X3 [Rosa rugosa]
MAVFLFTDGLCKEIANFWWGQTDMGGKVHWLSWEKLGLPKEEGGLGFRCLRDFNLALLAKVGWRIIQQPEALWVQVLKGLYFPHCDFLSASKGSRASWAWSSILEGRNLLSDHALWQVLNGESISTWKDKWIPGILGGRLSASHLYASEFDPFQRVADLVDWSSTSWNLDPIAQHLTAAEVVAIESIPLSSTWEPDKLVWPYEKCGSYSVRSGYHVQHGGRSKASLQSAHSSHIVNPTVWKQLWNVSSIPKVKHFLWRACTNALPTMANLFVKKVTPSPLCPFCSDHMETIEHLLLQCPWTIGVWFGLPVNYIVDLAAITTFDAWFSGVCEMMKVVHKSKMVLSCWISFALWIIWKERCAAVYDHREPSPWGVIAQIKAAVSEYSGLIVSGSSIRSSSVESVKWFAPLFPTVKLNCDGAWSSVTKRAGIGCIIRDFTGTIINGRVKTCLANSALHAEAIAVLEGLISARNLDFPSVSVEMDSDQLFSAIVSKPYTNLWHIYPLLRDIRKIKLEKPLWIWSLVKRKCNAVADWLATRAKIGGGFGGLDQSTSTFIDAEFTYRNQA